MDAPSYICPRSASFQVAGCGNDPSVSDYDAVCWNSCNTTRRELYNAEKSCGILSKILERQDAAAWTEIDLLPHIRSVLFTSVHSITTALTATLQFILSHPMTHLRLLKELRTAFGSAERVSLSPLPTSPYLNAVIDESLRLFPPIPLLGPRVSPGYIIDGRYVESGKEFYTSLYTLHRNPDYFPEPDSFTPERWCMVRWELSAQLFIHSRRAAVHASESILHCSY